jgi:hypothetical protein
MKRLLPQSILSLIPGTPYAASHYISQGTAEWKEQRKLAPVTASSIHDAIGLRERKDMLDHYHTHIISTAQKSFSPEVQEKIAHGTRHEIDAVVTLTSKFMPAFLPACYEFHETGARFIKGQH